MSKLKLRVIAAFCAWPTVARYTSFDRAPLPGKTTGKIYVGSPRVSGLERLVNDRREQEEWASHTIRSAKRREKACSPTQPTKLTNPVLDRHSPGPDCPSLQQTLLVQQRLQ